MEHLYQEIYENYLRGRFGENWAQEIDAATLKERKYFKRKGLLPRVSKALGILKGLYPQTILDIGIGRLNFLCPLLEELPQVNITSVDNVPYRTELVSPLVKMYPNYQVIEGDIQLSLKNTFDVVTALEVMEHVPDTEAFVKTVLALTNKYVIISVPSKPDDNPEHVHFFTPDEIEYWFKPHTVKMDGVLNHHVALIIKNK
mgnify:CR=1 FL=1